MPSLNMINTGFLRASAAVTTLRWTCSHPRCHDQQHLQAILCFAVGVARTMNA